MEQQTAQRQQRGAPKKFWGASCASRFIVSIIVTSARDAEPLERCNTMAITLSNPLPSTAGCDEGNCVFVESCFTNSEHDVERCAAGCGAMRYYIAGTRILLRQGYRY